MNLIIPIILIISSIGVFFGYVNPNYKGNPAVENPSDYSTYGIIDLQSELAKFKDISDSSNKIVAEQKNLVSKKNSIPTADQDRLKKLLPNNIDNIRLIVEISDIANRENLNIKNISVGEVSQNPGSIGPSGGKYGTLTLKFTVNATYTSFISFLKDLENNLRLIDVTDINFTATNSGSYDFNVTLNTYWLK